MGYVLAVLQSISFAATSISLKQLGRRLNVFLANGLRALFALLIMIPIIWLTGGLSDFQLITWEQYGYLALSIILGGVFGEVMYLKSLQRIGVARAFPITSAFPCFTVLFSALLMGETPTLPMIMGLGLVLVGVYVIARPKQDEAHDSVSLRNLVIGVLLALGTSAVWGIGTVIVALGSQGLNPLFANAIRLPIVVVISLAVAWKQGHMDQTRQMDKRLAGLLLLSSILSWVLTRTFYVGAVQAIGPSRTAIISAASPLFAIPMSIVVLKERPSLATLGGAALTIVGMVFVI